jgi:hypothetical protein
VALRRLRAHPRLDGEPPLPGAAVLRPVDDALLFGLLAGIGIDRTVAEIVFDLVGAGAIGSVIVASGSADEALRAMAGTVLVLPIRFCSRRSSGRFRDCS